MWLQVHAQERADARFEALATLTESKMREHGVPGVALGIVDGERVTSRGFGVTSVERRPLKQAGRMEVEKRPISASSC